MKRLEYVVEIHFRQKTWHYTRTCPGRSTELGAEFWAGLGERKGMEFLRFLMVSLLLRLLPLDALPLASHNHPHPRPSLDWAFWADQSHFVDLPLVSCDPQTCSSYSGGDRQSFSAHPLVACAPRRKTGDHHMRDASSPTAWASPCACHSRNHPALREIASAVDPPHTLHHTLLELDDVGVGVASGVA